jgi:hypothetical protein
MHATQQPADRQGDGTLVGHRRSSTILHDLARGLQVNIGNMQSSGGAMLWNRHNAEPLSPAEETAMPDDFAEELQRNRSL